MNDAVASPSRQALTDGGVVVVIGMSGAGRTTALKALEDMGFEAVDNLPLRLLPRLVAAEAPDAPADGGGLAIGVDIRTRDFTVDGFMAEVARLRAVTGRAITVLFLDCDDEVLRRRYTETRRLHPLAEDRPVTDGIARERRMLSPLRQAADVVLDSSHSNVHEFGAVMRDHFATGADGAPAAAGQVRVFVTSFSFRQGLPRDADLVLDLRFLRNPHYDPALRPLTGRDDAVGAYVAADPDFDRFFAQVTDMLSLLLPRFDREGKSYVTLAVGCTGGRHRSVFVAERLGRWIADAGRHVRVLHRDLPHAQDGG